MPVPKKSNQRPNSSFHFSLFTFHFSHPTYYKIVFLDLKTFKEYISIDIVNRVLKAIAATVLVS
jgi:hypothetical protein